MTVLNHGLTGAVVALTISNPAIGLPAAFFSHFAIDLMPHWDYEVDGPVKNRQKIMLAETLLLSFIVILFFFATGSSFWIASVGGLLAITPDFMWLPHTLHGRDIPKTNTVLGRARSVHSKIQFSESRKGIVIELFWAIAMITILFRHAK